MLTSRTMPGAADVGLGDGVRAAARFLARHWRFLAVATLLGFLAALVAVSLVAPQYKARAVLAIDGRGDRFATVPTAAADFHLELPFVETQAQMLHSPELAGRVINELQLRNDGELNPAIEAAAERHGGALRRAAAWGKQSLAALSQWWAATRRDLGLGAEAEDAAPYAMPGRRPNDDPVVQNFLKRLRVASIDKSYAIAVEYSSVRPVVAAQVANAVAQGFIDSEIEARRRSAATAFASLNDWLNDMRTKMLQAEKAVSEFRDEAGLTKVRGTTLSEQQLGDLNSQLIAARADRLKAEARLQQLRRSAKDAGQASPDAINSPLIQVLRAQESEVIRRAADLSSVYGERHPAMRNVQSELADLRKKIRLETDRLAQGLENEVAIARSREEFLETNLHKLEGTAGKLDASTARLNELEREAEALRAAYKQIVPRVTEIQLQEQHGAPDVRLAATAVVPQAPYFPKKTPAVAAASLGGFMIALMVALLRERMVKGFSFTEEVQQATGLPVIALLPSTTRRLSAPEIVTGRNTDPFFREALRSIQAALFLSSPTDAKTVLVTSSVSGEGKSFLSTGLAVQAARAGRRCLLIDCDLRVPTAHRALQLDGSVGIRQFLTRRVSTDRLVQLHDSGLHFIASGASAAGGAGDDELDSLPELLASPRFKALLQGLALQYDLIILDSPPALALSDAGILASLVDRIIYAVRWRDTGRETVMAAMQRIAGASDAGAAIVLTQVDTKRYAASASSDAELYSEKHHHYLQYKA